MQISFLKEPALYKPLPERQYDVLYADPPWYYGKPQHGGAGKVNTGGAETHYPTLKLPELKQLDVQSISKPDSVLFMWTTGPQLANAIQLGEAWGFEYKKVAFVWDKQRGNPGSYTYTSCEFVLLFKRGNREVGKYVMPQQLYSAKRGKHSSKPDAIRYFITQMYTPANRIELFARTTHDLWDSWGNEV